MRGGTSACLVPPQMSAWRRWTILQWHWRGDMRRVTTPLTARMCPRSALVQARGGDWIASKHVQAGLGVGSINPRLHVRARAVPSYKRAAAVEEYGARPDTMLEADGDDGGWVAPQHDHEAAAAPAEDVSASAAGRAPAPQPLQPGVQQGPLDVLVSALLSRSWPAGASGRRTGQLELQHPVVGPQP